ncbi:MAG TPA: adenosylmethionine decarboxylase [Casimicrobiaceae bacterium]|nr:adenosylmethionine decarboxylase [Casimicrobiaceae bacterium]
MTQIATNALTTVESGVRPVLGSQVVLDLYECETPHLDDLAWVKTTLVEAALAAGATIVETIFHKFAPWGISGVVVIAESHLAIHIWPENRYAAIDVFTCGENVRMDVASTFLKRAFRSKRAVRKTFPRGDQLRLSPGRPALREGKKPVLVRSASDG